MTRIARKETIQQMLCIYAKQMSLHLRSCVNMDKGRGNGHPCPPPMGREGARCALLKKHVSVFVLYSISKFSKKIAFSGHLGTLILNFSFWSNHGESFDLTLGMRELSKTSLCY